MLVIFRPPAGEGARSRLVAELANRLASAGRQAIFLPHLYFLTSEHAAVAYLRHFEGFTAAAYLHERAIVWTLRYLGIAAAVEPINLATFASGEDGAAALLAKALPASEAEAADFSAEVCERWYPVIDFDRCRHCRRCYDFCLFGVYSVDNNGQVNVAQPDRCKPGCPACARLCPVGAIIFPHCSTDEAIAGKPGAVMQSGQSAEEARAFAQQSIAIYQARRSSLLSKNDLARLDALIEEVERKDSRA